MAGWDWDDHLNGYVTKSHRKFACSCGQEHDVPGYQQCKCGKIWNSYAIGTGPDTRTASPEMFIAREIPVRDNVIVANRRTGYSDQGRFQEDFGGDLRTGEPLDEQQQRFINWMNRWNDMRDNAKGLYVPPGQRAAALDSPDYVQREFEDWLQTQGTSMEAERRNPRELQNKLDEFLAQRGGKDPVDEIMQFISFFKGAPFAGYEDFDACTSENSEKRDPSAYCGEIKHRTEDKMSAYTGYDDEAPEPFREQRDRQRSRQRAEHPTKGLSWEHRGMDDDQLGNAVFRQKAATVNLRQWLQETMRGDWLPEYEQTPSSIGSFWDELGKQHEPETAAPLRAATAMPTIQPRWHGKTPGGPQGPGVEGLKQKTKYKDVSTPQLRALQRQMMTDPQSMLDQELLRELSFREVLGAIHDLSSPGGTPDFEGRRTKRTDPDMSAVDDWHHRDKGGRWTRGDGHTLAAIA